LSLCSCVLAATAAAAIAIATCCLTKSRRARARATSNALIVWLHDAARAAAGPVCLLLGELGLHVCAVTAVNPLSCYSQRFRSAFAMRWVRLVLPCTSSMLAEPITALLLACLHAAAHASV
jgi:hypothetical protein